MYGYSNHEIDRIKQMLIIVANKDRALVEKAIDDVWQRDFEIDLAKLVPIIIDRTLEKYPHLEDVYGQLDIRSRS